MIFNSLQFAIFFIAIFVVFHLVLQRHNHKLWLITIGSLLFYAIFDYRFVPILLSIGMADFVIARRLADTTDERARKRLLVLSIACNLAVLGFFKYVNFFLGNLYGILRLFGNKSSAPFLHIILPVGISFYTFQ